MESSLESREGNQRTAVRCRSNRPFISPYHYCQKSAVVVFHIFSMCNGTGRRTSVVFHWFYLDTALDSLHISSFCDLGCWITFFPLTWKVTACRLSAWCLSHFFNLCLESSARASQQDQSSWFTFSTSTAHITPTLLIWATAAAFLSASCICCLWYLTNVLWCTHIWFVCHCCDKCPSMCSQGRNKALGQDMSLQPFHERPLWMWSFVPLSCNGALSPL